MKVAVGCLAEKVIVGLRVSKVTEMNSTGGSEALADDDGLTLGETLIEGLRERLMDGEIEPLGETDADTDPDGEIEADGLRVADADPLGEVDADGDRDSD